MALGIRRCLNIIIGILIRILRYDLKEVSKIKFNPVIFAGSMILFWILIGIQIVLLNTNHL